MPRYALDHMRADYCLPVAAIPELLLELVSESLPDDLPAPRVPEGIKLETEMARIRDNEFEDLDRLGRVSPYACPSCHGVLWQMGDDHVMRFRCHTGHAFTSEELAEGQNDQVEDALYIAIRALDESTRLAQSIAERSRRAARDRLAEMYETKAHEAEQSANVIRSLLFRGNR